MSFSLSVWGDHLFYSKLIEDDAPAVFGSSIHNFASFGGWLIIPLLKRGPNFKLVTQSVIIL
jgi:hypothetical protein